jgi:hypothetical protein
MFWDTSIWWVLAAAAAYFAIGSLWYSPAGFIKPWTKALGISPGGDMSGLAKLMATSFVVTIIIVVVEAYFVHVMKSPSWINGAYLGAKLWLLVGGTSLINSLYEKRPYQLYLVDQGYHLVGMVIAGAILVH